MLSSTMAIFCLAIYPAVRLHLLSLARLRVYSSVIREGYLIHLVLCYHGGAPLRPLLDGLKVYFSFSAIHNERITVDRFMLHLTWDASGTPRFKQNNREHPHINEEQTRIVLASYSEFN